MRMRVSRRTRELIYASMPPSVLTLTSPHRLNNNIVFRQTNSHASLFWSSHRNAVRTTLRGPCSTEARHFLIQQSRMGRELMCFAGIMFMACRAHGDSAGRIEDKECMTHP